MDYLKQQGLRIWRAFFFSVDGLRSIWASEPAFQQWVFLATVALPLGLWLGDSGVERALLAGAVVMVVIAEMVNSAIEAVVDRIGTEIHPLSKKAKDAGSAIVLVTASGAVLVWGLVLLG